MRAPGQQSRIMQKGQPDAGCPSCSQKHRIERRTLVGSGAEQIKTPARSLRCLVSGRRLVHRGGLLRRHHHSIAEHDLCALHLRGRNRSRRNGRRRSHRNWSRRNGRRRSHHTWSRRNGRRRSHRSWSRRSGWRRSHRSWSRRGGRRRGHRSWSRRSGRRRGHRSWSRRSGRHRDAPSQNLRVAVVCTV